MDDRQSREVERGRSQRSCSWVRRQQRLNQLPGSTVGVAKITVGEAIGRDEVSQFVLQANLYIMQDIGVGAAFISP